MAMPATPLSPAEAACQSTGCDVQSLFHLLGKTHTLPLLYLFITKSPRRFGEVEEEMRISPNTLAGRLKELVDAGLLTRTAYNEIPPRVDYAATQKALDLGPVFQALCAWAGAHDLEPEQAPAAPPVARA